MADPIAIVNARVIDGTGQPPIQKGVVVIEGKQIVDVGTEGSVEVPREAKVIDVGGRAVMPGLIDAHMHLTGMRTGDIVKEPLVTPYEVLVARAIRDLGALVDAGFTTVGDAGSAVALGLKRAVEEGTVKGPRVVAAGYVLSQTFGHGDTHYLPVEYVDARTTKKLGPLASLICDGVEECRKAARYALRAGADFIKVCATGGVLSERDRPEYTQFTREELEAIVQEAKHAGKFVHAHAQGTEGIRNALEAGVRVIAHAIFIDEDCAELSKEKSAVIVPTFSVTEHILKYGSEIGIPEWGLKKCEEVYEVHIENIKKAYRAGARLATGTDFLGGVKAFRHGDNALELAAFTEKLGMSPMEAIVAATKNAADAVGLGHRIGTLERGKAADMIIVDGDPLANLGVLLDASKIVGVLKEGTVLKDTLNILR